MVFLCKMLFPDSGASSQKVETSEDIWVIEPSPEAELILLDTYDWDLFRSGIGLVWIAGKLYVLPLKSGGLSPLSCACSPIPGEPEDIPRKNVRKTILKWAGHRALMPVHSRRIRFSYVELQDKEGFTIARGEQVCLWSGTDSDRGRRIFDLAPEKGCREKFRHVLFRLEADIITDAGACLGECFGDLIPPSDAQTRPCMLLTANDTLTDGISRSVLQLIDVMQHNVPGIVQDIDSECLHRYRVALRRIRSLLGIVRGGLPSPVVKKIRKILAVVAERSNRLRDIDVHILSRDEVMSSLPDSYQKGLNEFFSELRILRVNAHAELAAYLESDEYSGQIAAIRNLVRDSDENIQSRTSEILLIDSFRQGAAKAVRKALKALRCLNRDRVAPEELHRLRIRCKKARYLLEYLRDLSGIRGTASLAGAFRSLQTYLGDYHDFVVQEQTLGKFLAASHGQDHPAVVKSVEAVAGFLRKKQTETLRLARHAAGKLVTTGKNKAVKCLIPLGANP